MRNSNRPIQFNLFNKQMTEVSKDLWVMTHEQEQTYIQNYIYIDIPLYIYIQCVRDLTVKLLPCGI